jgi:hypothetical protein
MASDDTKITTPTGKMANFTGYQTSTAGPNRTVYEGEIQAHVTIDTERDAVIVSFGRQVSWVAMSLEQARLLAQMIAAKAKELEAVVPRAKVIQLHPPKRDPT